MEPVITSDGFKVLQNPDQARNLLSAYYEKLGFHVIDNRIKPSNIESTLPNTADIDNEISSGDQK